MAGERMRDGNAPGHERDDHRMSARDLRHVVAFTGLASTLAWLVALPLWFGDGLVSPWFPLVAVVVMTTPAAAALVVVSCLERPQQPARVAAWPVDQHRAVEAGRSAVGRGGSWGRLPGRGS